MTRSPRQGGVEPAPSVDQGLPRRRRNWTRRGVLAAAAIALTSASIAPGWGQSRSRPVRLGALSLAWGWPPELVALFQTLVGSGYRVGDDFVVAVWFTEGDPTALVERTREMVSSGVDILLTFGPLEAEAARLAAPDHPVVFCYVGDPIGQGLIETFARPGGRLTGVADLGGVAPARRLQLIAQMIPSLRRIGHPYAVEDYTYGPELGLYRIAAQRLGLVLLEWPLETQQQAEEVITGLGPKEVDCLLVPRNVALNIPGFLIDATRQAQIPSLFDQLYYAELGGLAAYGVNQEHVGARMASMVSQIMAGADPASIPAELPVRGEFVINGRVAGELGIAIPPMILFQADRILR